LPRNDSLGPDRVAASGPGKGSNALPTGGIGCTGPDGSDAGEARTWSGSVRTRSSGTAPGRAARRSVHPSHRNQRARVVMRETGRAAAFMTAWSSRADGQNTARELKETSTNPWRRWPIHGPAPRRPPWGRNASDVPSVVRPSPLKEKSSRAPVHSVRGGQTD
jgi:hypothetical protein